MSWNYFSEIFCSMPIWTLLLRVMLAVICGGAIGLEREYKHRPAGFRTYIIVCLSSALVMTIGEGLAIGAMKLGGTSDPARLGAQVISGIGFLGAGTIIVTGKHQVKGLTTAAGLWGSACIGLAIGCGFYVGAVAVTACLLLTLAILTKLDKKIFSNARYIDVIIEFEAPENVYSVIEEISKMGIKIFDVQLSRSKEIESYVSSAILNLKMPKRIPHREVIIQLSKIAGVANVQEV